MSYDPTSPDFQAGQPLELSGPPSRLPGTAYGLYAMQQNQNHEKYVPPLWAQPMTQMYSAEQFAQIDPTYGRPSGSREQQQMLGNQFPLRAEMPNPFNVASPQQDQRMEGVLGGLATLGGLQPGEDRGGTVSFGPLELATMPVSLANLETYMREGGASLASAAVFGEGDGRGAYQNDGSAQFGEDIQYRGETTGLQFHQQLVKGYIESRKKIGDIAWGIETALVAEYKKQDARFRLRQIRGLVQSNAAPLIQGGQGIVGAVSTFITDPGAMLNGESRFSIEGVIQYGQQRGLDPVQSLAELYDVPYEIALNISLNPELADEELDKLAEGPDGQGLAFSVDPGTAMVLEAGALLGIIAVEAVAAKRISPAIGSIGRGIAPASAAAFTSGLRGGVGALGQGLRGGGALATGARTAGWATRKGAQLFAAETVSGWGIRGIEWGIKQAAVTMDNQELVSLMDNLMYENPWAYNPGLNLMDAFTFQPVRAMRPLWKEGRIDIGTPNTPGHVAGVSLRDQTILRPQTNTGALDIDMIFNSKAARSDIEVSIMGERVLLPKDHPQAKLIEVVRTIEPDDMLDTVLKGTEWDRQFLIDTFGPGNPHDLTYHDLRNFVVYGYGQAVRYADGSSVPKAYTGNTMREVSNSYFRENAPEILAMLESDMRGETTHLADAIRGQWWDLADVKDSNLAALKSRKQTQYIPQIAAENAKHWVLASKVLNDAMLAGKDVGDYVPGYSRAVNRRYMQDFRAHVVRQYQPGQTIPAAEVERFRARTGLVERFDPRLKDGKEWTQEEFLQLIDDIDAAGLDAADKRVIFADGSQGASATNDPGLPVSELVWTDEAYPVHARALGLATEEVIAIERIKKDGPGTSPVPVRIMAVVADKTHELTLERLQSLPAEDAWKLITDWYDDALFQARDRNFRVRVPMLKAVARIDELLTEGLINEAVGFRAVRAAQRIAAEAVNPPQASARAGDPSGLGARYRNAMEVGEQVAQELQKHLDDPLLYARVLATADGVPNYVATPSTVDLAKRLANLAEFIRDNPGVVLIEGAAETAMIVDPNVHPLLKGEILLRADWSTAPMEMRQQVGGMLPNAGWEKMATDVADQLVPVADDADLPPVQQRLDAAATQAESYMLETQRLAGELVDAERWLDTVKGSESPELVELTERIMWTGEDINPYTPLNNATAAARTPEGQARTQAERALARRQKHLDNVEGELAEAEMAVVREGTERGDYTWSPVLRSDGSGRTVRAYGAIDKAREKLGPQARQLHEETGLAYSIHEVRDAQGRLKYRELREGVRQVAREAEPEAPPRAEPEAGVTDELAQAEPDVTDQPGGTAAMRRDAELLDEELARQARAAEPEEPFDARTEAARAADEEAAPGVERTATRGEELKALDDYELFQFSDDPDTWHVKTDFGASVEAATEAEAIVVRRILRKQKGSKGVQEVQRLRGSEPDEWQRMVAAEETKRGPLGGGAAEIAPEVTEAINGLETLMGVELRRDTAPTPIGSLRKWGKAEADRTLEALESYLSRNKLRTKAGHLRKNITKARQEDIDVLERRANVSRELFQLAEQDVGAYQVLGRLNKKQYTQLVDYLTEQLPGTKNLPDDLMEQLRAAGEEPDLPPPDVVKYTGDDWDAAKAADLDNMGSTSMFNERAHGIVGASGGQAGKGSINEGNVRMKWADKQGKVYYVANYWTNRPDGYEVYAPDLDPKLRKRIDRDMAKWRETYNVPDRFEGEAAPPPEVAPAPAPATPPRIEGGKTSFPDPFDETASVPATFRLMDVDALVTSDSAGFPKELQPRRRASAGSQQQMEKLGRQFDPELATRLESGGDGPPLVSDNGIVLAGNGRTMSMRTMTPEKWDQYKAHLMENADAYGLDRDAIANMEHPVLVRAVDDQYLTPKYAQGFNAGTGGMNAAEMAVAVSRLITPEDIQALRISEGVPLKAALKTGDRAEFVRRVLGDLTDAERRQYMDSKGALSDEGATLIERAMLTKLLGSDADMAMKLIENPDKVTRIRRGIEQALGQLLAGEALGRPPDPLSDALGPALARLIELDDLPARDRAAALTTVSMEAGADVSDGLANALTNMKSQQEIASFFREYADISSQQTVGMFEEAMPPLRNRLNEAITRVENARRADLEEQGGLIGWSADDGIPRIPDADGRIKTVTEESIGDAGHVETLPTDPVVRETIDTADRMFSDDPLLAPDVVRAENDLHAELIREMETVTAEQPRILGREAAALRDDPVGFQNWVEQGVAAINGEGPSRWNRGLWYLTIRVLTGSNRWVDGKYNPTKALEPNPNETVRDLLDGYRGASEVEVKGGGTTASPDDVVVTGTKQRELAPDFEEVTGLKDQAPPKAAELDEATQGSAPTVVAAADEAAQRSAQNKAKTGAGKRDTAVILHEADQSRRADALKTRRDRLRTEANAARADVNERQRRLGEMEEIDTETGLQLEPEVDELYRRYVYDSLAGPKDQGIAPSSPATLDELLSVIRSLDYEVPGRPGSTLTPEELIRLREGLIEFTDAKLTERGVGTLDDMLTRENLEAQGIDVLDIDDPGPAARNAQDEQALLNELARRINDRVVDAENPIDGYSGVGYQFTKPPVRKDGSVTMYYTHELTEELARYDRLVPGLGAELAAGKQLTAAARAGKGTDAALAAAITDEDWLPKMFRKVPGFDTAFGPRAQKEINEQAWARFTADIAPELDAETREQLGRGLMHHLHRQMQDHKLGSLPFGMYRRVGHLRTELIEKWSMDYLRSKGDDYAALVTRLEAEQAGGATPVWETFRKADNRIRAYFAERPGGLAALVDTLYDNRAVRRGSKIMAGMNVLYGAARFFLDARWVALEFVEAPLLRLGRDGPGAIWDLGKEPNKRLLFQTAENMEELQNRWAFWMESGDAGGYFKWRNRSLLHSVQVGQQQALIKQLEDMAYNDEILARMIRASGDTPEQYLNRLDQDWRLMQSKRNPVTPEEMDEIMAPYVRDGVVTPDELAKFKEDGTWTVHPELDAAIKQADASDPRLAAFYRRLDVVSNQVWDDAANLIFGRTQRSNMERLLNSPFLFWPISYQIKATKWLYSMMFDRVGGMQTGAGGAFMYQQLHWAFSDAIANDEDFQNTLKANKELLFLGTMLIPVTPWDVGLSLSPFTRSLMSVLSDNPDLDYQRSIFSVGPAYTYNNLFPRILAEQSEEDSFADAIPFAREGAERLRDIFPLQYTVKTKAKPDSDRSQQVVPEGGTAIESDELEVPRFGQ